MAVASSVLAAVDDARVDAAEDRLCANASSTCCCCDGASSFVGKCVDDSDDRRGDTKPHTDPTDRTAAEDSIALLIVVIGRD